MELARNLITESVARLRPPPAVCIDPGRPVADAVALMRRHRVGCVVACRAGRAVGLFTEQDLVRKVLAPGLPMRAPLSEVMTTDPVTVERTTPLGSALRLMQSNSIRHLPVTGPGGEVVGIVSVRSLVHFVVGHFPGAVYCLPPEPNVHPAAARGA